MDEWITQSQFAKLKGISQEAVRQAILAGRLESNGKTGRACRVRGPLVESVQMRFPRAQTDSPAAESYIADLTGAKLKKLNNEIKLQNQKLNENRAQIFRAIFEAVSASYAVAWTDVKEEISRMRITPATKEKWRELIDRGNARFETELKNRMMPYV